MKAEENKMKNVFLDIYIIVATVILLFAMFVSNYALIDNLTYKPFQQTKGVDEVCGPGTNIEDIKITYVLGESVTVFSEEDKLEALSILSSLSIQPRGIKEKGIFADEGIIIIDNIRQEKHVKIGINSKYIYLSGKDYNISNTLYYQKINNIIENYK